MAPRRFVLAALAIYGALALAVFRAVLAGGTYYAGDVYKYFLPAWVEVTSQLRQGTIPAWTPSWSCGAPLLGGMACSALYPPVILCAWLPPAWGFALCVSAHVPFAALGFALFLRGQGVGARAALLGGGAFGFSGFALCLTSICPAALYVVAWSGWLLLLVERLLQRPGPRRAAALALAGGAVGLAGEPQYALHLALLLLGWVALRPSAVPRWRGLGWLALAGAVAGLLAAPLLGPALEVMRHGERQAALGYAYTASWPLLPRQLLTLGAPFLFGSSLHDFPNPTSVLTADAYPYLYTVYLGALPLLLICAAPWSPQRRLAAFCALCAAGFGLVALGPGFGAHRALYEALPLYDRFRFPYKAWPGAALGLAGLAALGCDALSARPARRAAWAYGGAAALLLLLIGPGQGLLEAAGQRLASGYPPALGALLAARLGRAGFALCAGAALLAGVCSGRVPRRAGWSLVGALALLELAWAASPAVATAPNASVAQLEPAPLVPPRLHLTPFSARYGEIEAFPSLPAYVSWASREALVANTGRWRGVEHFRGCDKTFAPWHERLFRACEQAPPAARVRLLAACGVELLESNLPPPPGLGTPEPVGGDLYRARIQGAFPRAYWVPEARRVASQDAAAWALLTGEVDLSQVALLPDAKAEASPTQEGAQVDLKLDLRAIPGPRASSVPEALEIVVHDAREVRVRAPGRAGVVVVLDTWFPGWTAEVDGRPRPLLRANVAFRGVEVSAEDRELVLRYRPRALRRGVIAWAVGCLLAIGLAVAPSVSRSIRRPA
ncbi:MAG: hypothetical protein R3F62_00100 [Planctomycetota bacterium]